MTTVWIYESGDTLKTFASEEEASAWLKANDPEGVVFKAELSELRPAGSADGGGVEKLPVFLVKAPGLLTCSSFTRSQT